MTLQAPQDIRRSNTRAVENRAQWRARYAQITVLIRRTRSELQRDPCNNLLRLNLESLRMRAAGMMMQRDLIGWDLKNTAYAWV